MLCHPLVENAARPAILVVGVPVPAHRLEQHALALVAGQLCVRSASVTRLSNLVVCYARRQPLKLQKAAR